MIASLAPAPCGGWRGSRAGGQVLVIFALGLVGLVALLGLVLDGGLLYMERRTAQNGADAAALAGAYALSQLQSGAATTDATVATGVCKYVSANRFGPGVPTASAVFVGDTTPPAAIRLTPDCTGPQPATGVPASATGVQVTVAITYPTYLVGIVGVKQLSVMTTATASITAAPTPGSLVALNGTACPSLNVTNASQLTVNAGNIQVNSNCAGAMQVAGDSTVNATQGSINVVGTAQAAGRTITPPPAVSVPAINDPFANLPIPNLTGLPSQPPVICAEGTTMTINPGVYPSITTATGCRLTVNPGNYIIGSGSGNLSIGNGDTVSFGSSTRNTTIVLTNGMTICCVGTGVNRPVGTNVLFYNACLNYASDLPGPCAAGEQFGPIALQEGVDLSLVTPQSTGAYKNVTFFQDRGNPATMLLDGAVTLNAGTIYGKTMPMIVTGSATAPVQFVVDSMTISGGAVVDSVANAQVAPVAGVIQMTQ